MMTFVYMQVTDYCIPLHCLCFIFLMCPFLRSMALILIVRKQWPGTHSFSSSNPSMVSIEVSAFALRMSEEKRGPLPGPPVSFPL